MTESIHGHATVRRMIDSEQVYTEETFPSDIAKGFGDPTRLLTCSADGVTADALVAFLAARRKFYTEGKGFKVDEDEICDDA